MALIISKSKKYPPISSKAACKICPKVIPDGPKKIGSKSKNFQTTPLLGNWDEGTSDQYTIQDVVVWNILQRVQTKEKGKLQ